MTPATLQAKSKTKRLVDFGRTLFKRQSDSKSISARSQRVFRVSRPKDIWKSGLNKARNQWNQVRKEKRKEKRETAFDSMYPVGRISHPMPHFPTDSEQDVLAFLTPPVMPPVENHRLSSAPSVTVTTPTPSNSQKDQDKRQSQYMVHEGDEPSPLFTARARPNPHRVSIRHPQSTIIYRSFFNDDEVSLADQSNDSSNVSSSASTPQSGSFPGQVNPREIAKKRESEFGKRFSKDILDGVLRSDRDQLPSQRERNNDAGELPTRPLSEPLQTPPVLKPGAGAQRPMTMAFPPPSKPFSSVLGSIPEMALPAGSMDDLRYSLIEITGDNSDTERSQAQDDALAALQGDRDPVREASAVHEWEVKSALVYGHDIVYPGQGCFRRSAYIPLVPEVNQKAVPVPPKSLGGSVPTPPSTPNMLASKGKKPADANVQKNLEKAHRRVRSKHIRNSKLWDKGDLFTPPVTGETGSWTDGSSAASSRIQSPVPVPVEQRDPKPAPAPAPRPMKITRKPVAKQPSIRKANTDKPLPQLPAERSSVIQSSQQTQTPPRHQPQPQAAAAPAPPRNAPYSRITILEERLAVLEASQALSRAPVSTAAAGARAAANLHSAMRASSSVPAAPRPSKHRPERHEERKHAKPFGSRLRDMLAVGKNVMRGL